MLFTRLILKVCIKIRVVSCLLNYTILCLQNFLYPRLWTYCAIAMTCIMSSQVYFPTCTLKPLAIVLPSISSPLGGGRYVAEHTQSFIKHGWMLKKKISQDWKELKQSATPYRTCHLPCDFCCPSHASSPNDSLICGLHCWSGQPSPSQLTPHTDTAQHTCGEKRNIPIHSPGDHHQLHPLFYLQVQLPCKTVQRLRDQGPREY